MNPNDMPKSVSSNKSGCQVSEISIAQLVGQVYEFAPPAERSRLLEHLLKPLGVLSLVAVANGLADMLAASPVMTGSAAAALLITLLLQRARTRRASDREPGDSAAART